MLLTIFNHVNYIGYFFIKYKLELIAVLDEEDIDHDLLYEMLKEWIVLADSTKDFNEVMRVEKTALNLLLDG